MRNLVTMTRRPNYLSVGEVNTEAEKARVVSNMITTRARISKIRTPARRLASCGGKVGHSSQEIFIRLKNVQPIVMMGHGRYKKRAVLVAATNT